MAIPVIPPTGTGKVRTVIFGSSTDEHNHITLDGSLTVSAAGVATFTSPNNHLIGSGAMGFLAPNKDFGQMDGNPLPNQDRRAFGPLTRTGAKTLTMEVTTSYGYTEDTNHPVKQWPAITTAVPMNLHIMTSLAPQAWFRELNNQLNGALELVAT